MSMLAASLAALSMVAPDATAKPAFDTQYLEITSFDSAICSKGPDGETIWTLSNVKAPRPFDEVVPSWDAWTVGGGRIRVELAAGQPERFFILGDWSQDQPRTSVNDQRTDYAHVATDTLVLQRPSTELSVRIVMTPGGGGQAPQLHRLSLALSLGDPMCTTAALPEVPRLNVPKRAQMSYQGGNVLCSPTSVSMVLAYWSQVLDRAGIDRDVPLVQLGVYDDAWKGTGNWAFNTSYAAAVPGLTAYVARLRDVQDLASWLQRGAPVVCSVSYDLLKGKGARGDNDGHLVVLTGITPDGKLLFNDPGRNVVEMTYERADFEAAWSTSKNTVYLIYPETWSVPVREAAPWRGKG